jgi:hypothetical protein
MCARIASAAAGSRGDERAPGAMRDAASHSSSSA